MRRETEGALEGAREMGFGNAADLREALDGPGLMGGGVHAVFRAQQAAQEGWVLQGCGVGWFAMRVVDRGSTGFEGFARWHACV